MPRFVAQPLRDWLDALDACMGEGRRAHLVVIVLGFLLSWWIYVPVHELAHAWGCLLAGGDVTRLEIDGIYGAALLAKVFPYVTVGSEYAGRLSGFDTHGRDVTYLAACALPYVLTIFIGVPLLRAVPRSLSPYSRGAPRLCRGAPSVGGHGGPAARPPMLVRRRSLLLGAALPIAYAPFVSLTGDYYEMGSILVSRMVGALAPGFAVDRWRSDDVVKLVGALARDARISDAAGVAASLLLGAALAWSTYWAGVLVSGWTGRSKRYPG